MVLYSDGPTMEVSIDVDAKPATIWRFVSDIEMPIRFSQELVAADWLPPHDGPALGARFQGTNTHEAVGEWQVTCEVAWYEPSKVFGWNVIARGETMASWRFTVEESAGGSGLTFWARMGPSRAGLSAAIDAAPDREEEIIEDRLAEWRYNMEATVAGVKDLAEAG